MNLSLRLNTTHHFEAVGKFVFRFQDIYHYFQKANLSRLFTATERQWISTSHPVTAIPVKSLHKHLLELHKKLLSL